MQAAPRITYDATRDRVHAYFDRTATRTWERLTSDAPVSKVRQTVREGRDRMREVLIGRVLAALAVDGDQPLAGRRILDAGCGTGALAIALAEMGAEVVAIDIAANLIDIAKARHPHRNIDWRAGDMTDPALGRFDAVVAMDSMIYYDAADLAAVLGQLAPRVAGPVVFTLPPRTPLLMAMWRVGKVFPRSDRSPVMIPQSAARLGDALRKAGVPGQLAEHDRITSGFYISTAHEFRGDRG